MDDAATPVNEKILSEMRFLTASLPSLPSCRQIQQENEQNSDYDTHDTDDRNVSDVAAESLLSSQRRPNQNQNQNPFDSPFSPTDDSQSEKMEPLYPTRDLLKIPSIREVVLPLLRYPPGLEAAHISSCDDIELDLVPMLSSCTEDSMGHGLQQHYYQEEEGVPGVWTEEGARVSLPPASSRLRDSGQWGIEIAPNVFRPLRAVEETYEALKTGQGIVETTCYHCNLRMVCVSDCDCVLCPHCLSTGPLECNDNRKKAESKTDYSPPHVGGVGMGVHIA